MTCIDDHGVALNEFLDVLSEFVEGLKDVSPTHGHIARQIANALLCGTELQTDDPNHVFQKYATDSKAENIRNLAYAIASQNQSDRSIVLSFFHNGGVYRDELDELMESYYDFADYVLCDGQIDDTDSDSDDSETDSQVQQQRPVVPVLRGGPFAAAVAAY